MNLKLHWSTKAIQDLDKIYSFYSKGNEKAAVDLYNAILDAIELLCSFPEMASHRADHWKSARGSTGDLWSEEISKLYII